MQRRIIISLFITAMLSVASLPVQAASFCIAGAGLSPQCFYDDMNQCIRAAESPATACIVNPDTNLNYSGGANYCVVTSGLTALCMYVDRAQCEDEAMRNRGICISRADMDDDTDPFRYDPRI